ncbi:MAG TPA: hypothetical protein VFO77_05355 [Actinoplanes sp.]|nr:hypothetical protein [Actinoplanes sp.]
MSPNEPQGSAAEHTSAIERAVDQIRENIDVILQKVNAGIDNADSNWFLLSPALKIWISRSIDALRESLDKIMVIAREVLAHYTPVVSLVNISFHWLDVVKKPVTNMVPTIERWATRDRGAWDGSAAKHYESQVVPAQKAAVEALGQKAGLMSEWLYGIAMANIQYVTKLSEVIGKILGEVAAAALEAATVINIPWAIDRLAAAVGAIVEVAVNDLLGIVQRIVEAGGRLRQLASDTADYSKFPDGAWPQAVTG